MQVDVGIAPGNFSELIWKMTDEETIIDDNYSRKIVSDDSDCSTVYAIFYRPTTKEPIGYLTAVLSDKLFYYSKASFYACVERHNPRAFWLRSTSAPHVQLNGFVHVYSAHRLVDDPSFTVGQLIHFFVNSLRHQAEVVGSHPWKSLARKESFASMLILDPKYCPSDQYTPMGELCDDLKDELGCHPACTKLEFIWID